MIETKLFELRDKGTFIPIFAFRNIIKHWAEIPNYTSEEGQKAEQEQYLLSRAGFSKDSELVTIGRLECSDARFSECSYDIYGHNNPRTWGVAHQYIEEHWEQLKSGEVIDVEYILGEISKLKESERYV